MKLSIKKIWLYIVMFTLVVPVMVVVLLGGSRFYNQLMHVELNHVKNRVNMVYKLSSLELNRLIALLESKSDPMVYTFEHSLDQQLLRVMLDKMVAREPSIHLVLIADNNGTIIASLSQQHDPEHVHQHISIEQHWAAMNEQKPNIFQQVLNGDIFIGEGNIHQGAQSLIVALPLGSKKNPGALLWAEIDVVSFWENVRQHLSVKAENSYLVDGDGILLVKTDSIHYSTQQNLRDIPIVQAYVSGHEWSFDHEFPGIHRDLSYGTYKKLELLPWAVISEVEKEHIQGPIKQFFINLLLSLIFLIALIFVIGMLLARQIITPINQLISEFKRVPKQQYQVSEVKTPLVEIESLVSGFDQMVSEIESRQQKLHQAAIVYDNTSEGIVITDKSAAIINVNKAFTEITGYQPEESLGKNPSILSSGRHDHEFYKNMWQDLRRTGQWRGEIWNRRKNGEIFPQLLTINTLKDNIGHVTHYIGTFSDISNLKETEERLDRLAHTDVLTGLPNRLLCEARMMQVMQSAKRNRDKAAILFLDLDNFKNVNDSLGHIRGDILLKQVAERMMGEIRDEDILARLGGDEFIIILGSLKTNTDASRVADLVLSLLCMPFHIDNHEVFISGSIGISIYPDDGEAYETLLRNADSAMYKAKSSGRSNYQYYTSRLTDQAYQRLNMETHLRYALERNELFLVYQPQFSIESHELIGVETLIRWQHPEMGLISPDNFIPVAEDTGLIVPIGLWVIETACKQLMQWQQNNLPINKLAINLSAVQFSRPGLVDQVGEILKETGIQPNQIDFEITESVLMLDTNITMNTLNTFSEMGMELSIDDFGTGYSSLSYIRRFPINRLKIDRSFVSDIARSEYDADMILAIIALGHSMGLLVLAEGVETEEQLNFLINNDCDEMQGYIYSKPMKPEVFAENLKSGAYVFNKNK